MTTLRTLALATLAAPLTLGLAACDSSDGAEGGLSGDAIEAIDAPEGGGWLDMAVKTEEGGYLVGNPDAPIKLVEFASHTCGGCAAFAESGAAAIKADYVTTGVVSYEIRNLIRDPLDLTIATLAQCGDPASFHPRSDQAWAALGEFSQTINQNGAMAEQAMGMPEDQRMIGLAQAAGLIDWFAARGLSRNQAQACLADAANVTAIADTSSEQAELNNVNSTPTFLINGNNIGNQSWATLEPMLQDAGAR